jgi:hypothetical protein
MSSTVEQGGRGGVDMARLLVSFGPLIFLAALMIVFTIMSPNFIDPRTRSRSRRPAAAAMAGSQPFWPRSPSVRWRASSRA